MRYVYFLFFLVITTNIFAQENEVCSTCSDYIAFMRKGHEAYNQGVYAEALGLYQAAQVAAKVCQCSTTEPAKEIFKIFESVEKQKKMAEEQKKMAQQMTHEAELQLWNAKIALKNAQILNLISTANLAIYKEGDITQGIRYAQYAEKKSSNSIDKTNSQIAFFRTLYQPIAQPQNYFYHSLQHEGAVWDIKLSPNGKYVASASEDNTVKLWDLEKEELITTYQGHTAEVRSVAFSPDGSKIASASEDNTVKIWEIATGKLLHNLKGHHFWVTSAIFSPDGKKVISYSWDKTIKIWDTEQGNLLADLKGHTEKVNDIAISPNGKKLASASADSTVKIWETETGKLLMNLAKEHSDEVRSVAFSPDGEEIISTSWDNKIIIWDSKTGKKNFTLLGHSNKVNDAQFSPDGTKIISVSADKTIKIWEVKTGTLLKTLEGHKGNVFHAYFSVDGKKILSISEDNTIKIWDIENGKLLVSLQGHKGSVYCAMFSPNGNIISASQDKTLKIWKSIDSFGLLREINTEIEQGLFVNAVFSPNDSQIIAAGGNIYELYDNQISIYDSHKMVKIAELKGYLTFPNYINYTSDGEKIIGIVNDNKYGEVCIWNAKTQEKRGHYRTLKCNITSQAISPNNKEIAVGYSNGTIKFLNAENGVPNDSIKLGKEPINFLSYSPKGNNLLIGFNKKILVWETKQKEVVDTIKVKEKIRKILFTPNGKIISIAFEDKAIKIRDSITWNVLSELDGHSSDIIDIALSIDGKYIVSASNVKSIKLWDIETNFLLGDLQGHTDKVNSVAFSSDGKKILSSSSDGTIKVWTIDIPTIIERYKDKIDDLSPEEKEKYGIED